MIFIWLFAVVTYLVFNTIITVSFLSDGGFKHKEIVAIVSMLFGLPIMIVVVGVTMVLGVIEVIKTR